MSNCDLQAFLEICSLRQVVDMSVRGMDLEDLSKAANDARAILFALNSPPPLTSQRIGSL
jgi:hypothetical protein